MFVCLLVGLFNVVFTHAHLKNICNCKHCADKYANFPVKCSVRISSHVS